jgi:hypothetical protein
LKSFRQLMRIPGERRRQWLRFIVKLQGRQVCPRDIAT